MDCSNQKMILDITEIEVSGRARHKAARTCPIKQTAQERHKKASVLTLVQNAVRVFLDTRLNLPTGSRA
jgi:hypothetical protein